MKKIVKGNDFTLKIPVKFKRIPLAFEFFLTQLK
jgi:hypothetical protein